MSASVEKHVSTTIQIKFHDIIHMDGIMELHDLATKTILDNTLSSKNASTIVYDTADDIFVENLKYQLTAANTDNQTLTIDVEANFCAIWDEAEIATIARTKYDRIQQILAADFQNINKETLDSFGIKPDAREQICEAQFDDGMILTLYLAMNARRPYIAANIRFFGSESVSNIDTTLDKLDTIGDIFNVIDSDGNPSQCTLIYELTD